MYEIVWFGLIACATAFAQPKSDSTIAAILRDLGASRRFQEVAISPDGQRAALAEEATEQGNDSRKAGIYVKALASLGGEGGTPDSTRIAFLSADPY